MRKVFNKVREFVFRGAESRLSVAYRTYMIILFLSIIMLAIQNTAFRYSGSKIMLSFYLIVFLIIPIILAIATVIKGANRIKERRGNRK